VGPLEYGGSLGGVGKEGKQGKGRLLFVDKKKQKNFIRKKKECYYNVMKWACRGV